MSTIMSSCFKPSFKFFERFCQRIAFNLGNTPSQTEVKIISCIPIDVSELQTKIMELERELEECRLSKLSEVSRSQFELLKTQRDQLKAQQGLLNGSQSVPLSEPPLPQANNVATQVNLNSTQSVKYPPLKGYRPAASREKVQTQQESPHTASRQEFPNHQQDASREKVTKQQQVTTRKQSSKQPASAKLSKHERAVSSEKLAKHQQATTPHQKPSRDKKAASRQKLPKPLKDSPRDKLSILHIPLHHDSGESLPTPQTGHLQDTPLKKLSEPLQDAPSKDVPAPPTATPIHATPRTPLPIVPPPNINQAPKDTPPEKLPTPQTFKQTAPQTSHQAAPQTSQQTATLQNANQAPKDAPPEKLLTQQIPVQATPQTSQQASPQTSQQTAPLPNVHQAPGNFPAPNVNQAPRDAPPPNINQAPRDAPPPNVNQAPRDTPPPNVNQATRDAPAPNVNQAPRDAPPPNVNQASRDALPPNVNQAPRDAPPPNINQAPRDAPPPNVNQAPRDTPPPNVNQATRDAPAPNVNQAPRDAPPPNVNQASRDAPPPNVNQAPRDAPPPNVNQAPRDAPPPNLNQAPSDAPPLNVNQAPSDAPPSNVNQAPTDAPPPNVNQASRDAPPLNVNQAPRDAPLSNVNQAPRDASPEKLPTPQILQQDGPPEKLQTPQIHAQANPQASLRVPPRADVIQSPSDAPPEQVPDVIQSPSDAPPEQLPTQQIPPEATPQTPVKTAPPQNVIQAPSSLHHQPMCPPGYHPMEPVCPPCYSFDPVCPPGYRSIDPMCYPPRYPPCGPYPIYQPTAPNAQTQQQQPLAEPTMQQYQQCPQGYCPIGPVCPPGCRPIGPCVGTRYQPAAPSGQTMQQYRKADSNQVKNPQQKVQATPSDPTSQLEVAASAQTSLQYIEIATSAQTSEQYEDSSDPTSNQHRQGSPYPYQASMSSNTSVEIQVHRPLKTRQTSSNSMNRMRAWWHSRRRIQGSVTTATSSSSFRGTEESESCAVCGFDSRQQESADSPQDSPCSNCMPFAINNTGDAHQMPPKIYVPDNEIVCSKKTCLPRTGLRKSSPKKIKEAISHLFYRVQPNTNTPFHDEKTARNRRNVYSPGYVSSSYLQEVARKQFNPEQAAVASVSSRFSKPICRDEDPAPKNPTRVVESRIHTPYYKNQPTCSGYQQRRAYVERDCKRDEFLGIDRNRSSADPGPSVANAAPASDNSVYYDSSLYDIVPVKDTPHIPNIDKVSKNTKQCLHLQLKPHLHNGRLPVKERDNSGRQTPPLGTQTGSVDFSEIYTKPFVKNRIQKMESNMMHNRIAEEKEVRSLSKNLTHTECQTAPLSNYVKLEPSTPAPASAKNHVETLDPIKNTLRSVIVEVKESIPRGSKTRNGPTFNSALGSAAPHPLQQPAIYHPMYANMCPRIYTMLSHTTGQCSSGFPARQATNTNTAPAQQRGKATEELIKEIYRSLAVSARPSTEASTSNGSDCSRESTTLGRLTSALSANNTTGSSRELPQASARATLSNNETHQGSTKHRRSHKSNAPGTCAADTDSDATITRSQNKINLFDKIRRLFNGLRVYDIEVDTTEDEECSSEDLFRMYNQLSLGECRAMCPHQHRQTHER